MGRSVTYTTTFPSGRLNFWTSLGIRDGAEIAGEVQFQVKINGQNLLGQYFHLNPNYWVWKRWVPIMVDVSPWAGQSVTIELLTTGNIQWGWTIWGSLAIYQTDAKNLAFGAPVSVSSGDGSHLTDGNVDGQIWSSESHASSSATEWAQIDLGSSEAAGKVVLFPRSDFGFGGFPVSFNIQASDNQMTWTDLVVENNNPGAQGGDGQIFTFQSATVRYVRVISNTLAGVGGEGGYRFDLVEVQVFE